MGGFSTPLLVRDTVAVCAAPPLPEDVRIKFRRRVPLKLALNTVLTLTLTLPYPYPYP